MSLMANGSKVKLHAVFVYVFGVVVLFCVAVAVCAVENWICLFGCFCLCCLLDALDFSIRLFVWLSAEKCH